MPTSACILSEFGNILLFLLQFGSFKINFCNWRYMNICYKYAGLAYNTSSTSIWHHTLNFICALSDNILAILYHYCMLIFGV